MTNQFIRLRGEDLKFTFLMVRCFINEIQKNKVKHIPANQLGQAHYSKMQYT